MFVLRIQRVNLFVTRTKYLHNFRRIYIAFRHVCPSFPIIEHVFPLHAKLPKWSIAFIKTKPVWQENMLGLIPGCDSHKFQFDETRNLTILREADQTLENAMKYSQAAEETKQHARELQRQLESEKKLIDAVKQNAKPNYRPLNPSNKISLRIASSVWGHITEEAARLQEM